MAFKNGGHVTDGTIAHQALAGLPRRGAIADLQACNRNPNANLASALIAAQRAAGPCGRPAVIDDAGCWSVAELESAITAAAGALTRFGIRRGDRVAVALPPGRAWLQAFLGTVHLGAVAVPVDPDDGLRLARFLEDVRPAALVTDRDPPVRGLASIRSTQLDSDDAPPVAAVAPDDCAFLVGTSGSTGRPKGVMHAHGPAARPGYVKSVLAIGPGDRVLAASAGFTALGLFIGILRPLAAGACVVLSGRRPTPRAVIAAVAAADVTMLAAVPTFWAQLAVFLERHPDQRGPIAWLRRAVASGERLPAAVARRLHATTGVELLDGFGSAECGDIVIGRRSGESPRGVGRAVPGVDLRLEDEAGGATAACKPGRLLVRCPTATLGYWERPEETAVLYDGGWLRTGDLMSRGRGIFRSHGRADDLLKVGGQWLRPAEAEACLYEHPAVVEAAVVGMRSRHDADYAAVFVAVGESSADGLAGDLRRILAQRVGKGAALARVTLVDHLPRLASGKLDRRALVELNAA